MSTADDRTTKIEELDKLNKEQSTRITDLENKLRYEGTGFEYQIQKQSDEIKELQEQNKASDNEISRLIARVKDLERCLYPSGRMIFTVLFLPISLHVNDKRTTAHRNSHRLSLRRNGKCRHA